MKPNAEEPFEPPRERGTLRALALAALMHVLLALFLYHGMKWQNSTPAGTEAEIWTEVPAMPPFAPAPAQLAPPPTQRDEADITLQQEKRRKQQEAERQAQFAEQERLRKQAEQQAEARRQQLAAQKAATGKLKQQHAQAEKLREQQLAEHQRQEQLKKQEALKAQQLKAQQEKLDQERRARLAQLQGLAGDTPGVDGLAKSGTGSGSGGTAASASYADKVQRRVRSNIIWSGPTTGLETLIAVRCAPDGALLDARVMRPSGNPQWDDAALRAVQRSDPMPLDANGKAPANFNIRMRPAGG